MANNQSYFSHDSNARNSDKLIKVRMDLGAEGYGIYFMILERLREEDNYKSKKDYKMIAFDLRVEVEKIEQVINNYDLFVIEDDVFYSNSFLERMNLKDAKRLKAQAAINRRWEKERKKKEEDLYKRNTDVLETYNQRNTDSYKEKKRKEKESKEKQSKEKQSKENTIKDCNAPSAGRRGRTFTFESLVLAKYGNDESLLEAFKDFEIMRKSIKKPLTERAVKTMLTKLENLAGDDIDKTIKILEQSILNSWAGVFELKSGGDVFGTRGNDSEVRGKESQGQGKWDKYDWSKGRKDV